jgi:hypothetical protein
LVVGKTAGELSSADSRGRLFSRGTISQSKPKFAKRVFWTPAQDPTLSPFIFDRSWVEGDVAVPVDRGISSQSTGQFPEPIVRQFRTALSLTLRDGQTVESTFATDPMSGKVFKVAVSLSALK